MYRERGLNAHKSRKRQDSQTNNNPQKQKTIKFAEITDYELLSGY